jgi:hypothetical protein
MGKKEPIYTVAIRSEVHEQLQEAQARIAQLEARLAAIQQAAEPIAEALNALPDWTDVSTPLSALHFMDGAGEVEDALDGHYPTIADLQALVKALEGEGNDGG